jgi:peptidoglycan-associated lipoprotein
MRTANRTMRLAAVVVAGLALTACAKTDVVDASAYGVAAPGSPQDFAANVGDRIFFDTDETDLNPTAQQTLDKQAVWLNRYPQYKITVEGHADERGTREYNFALGAKRSEAAKAYLIAKHVAASRLKTVSYGKERPVAVCNDISCWSQNRRAVTVLEGGGPS